MCSTARYLDRWMTLVTLTTPRSDRNPRSASARRLRSAALASSSFALVLMSATASHAVTNYTWYSGKVSSNVTLKESGNSLNWLRKGVKASLKADGPYFRTTVWLGTASSYGAVSANLSAGKLVSHKTKEKWILLPHHDEKGKVHTTVTLTGVPTGGGMVAPAGVGSEDKTTSMAGDSDIDANAYIESANGAQSTQARSSQLEVSAQSDVTVTKLAQEGDVSFWRVDEGEDYVHLGIRAGGYTASTWVTPEFLAEHGAPLALNLGDHAIRAVLVPAKTAADPLVRAGLRKVGPGLYREVAQGSWDERVSLDVQGSRLTLDPDTLR